MVPLNNKLLSSFLNICYLGCRVPKISPMNCAVCIARNFAGILSGPLAFPMSCDRKLHTDITKPDADIPHYSVAGRNGRQSQIWELATKRSTSCFASPEASDPSGYFSGGSEVQQNLDFTDLANRQNFRLPVGYEMNTWPSCSMHRASALV